MKFSIITCTFNRLDKLMRNIASVKHQQYNNYEHFIIDDGSNDGTQEYINTLKDKNINYIRFEKNLGQPHVMYNSDVLRKINADLFFFLDSDDFLLPNALRIIVKDFEYYKKTNPWTIAYSVTENNDEKISNDIEYKYIMHNSLDILSDFHPLNIHGTGFVDHLFVHNNKFLKNFITHFNDPYKWYAIKIDVSLKNKFKEIYTNRILLFTNFDRDSVTKGKNIEKYKPITLVSRKYLFDNYQNNMGDKYFKYTLNSLILNLLIDKKMKSNVFKYMNMGIKHKKINLKNYIFYIILFLFPANFIFKIKKILKISRQSRFSN